MVNSDREIGDTGEEASGELANPWKLMEILVTHVFVYRIGRKQLP